MRERASGGAVAKEVAMSAMKTWRRGIAAGVIAGALLLGLASCGDDNVTTTTAPPTLSEDPLHLEIQSAVVPDFATTARPTVTFRVTDGSNNPIDLEAELATTTTFPNLRATGARAPTFTLAMLDDHGDYVSYYSTTRAAAAYTYTPDPEVIGSTPFVPPAGVIDPTDPTGHNVTFPTPVTRTQATSNAIPNALGATLEHLGNRVYRFTFPTPTSTAGMDRTKTHTVAGWVVRKPNKADSDVAHASFNFVPAGGTAQRLETVTDAACSKCHGFVQAHGTRRGVQFCITCHSPQTGDPETDRTVNFKVMIHKIHAGADLPSVRQKIPYFIVGYSGPLDWSNVSFPWHDHGVRHCTVCHSGQDADNWKTKPTLTACTACHDNVKFVTGEAAVTCPLVGATPTATLGFFADCMHAGGPITVSNPNDVTTCIGCHGPGAAQAVDRYHHGD